MKLQTRKKNYQDTAADGRNSSGARTFLSAAAPEILGTAGSQFSGFWPFAEAHSSSNATEDRPVGASARAAGSVLLVTLSICMILGLLMASYLSVIKGQNFSVARAQAWNSAIVVAEAGVEEALAQLNDTNLIKLGIQTPQGFNANKWLPPDLSHAGYWKTNILTDGVRTNGYYEVIINTNSTANPLIISTGYVSGPLSSSVLKRVVQVKSQAITKSTPSGAMVVTDTVDFKGFGITTDSFQSTNLTLFPGGLYNSANALDHGDVGSTSRQTNAMNLGNAKVKGSVHTSQYGSAQIGSQGVVGDKAYVESGSNSGKIEDKHQLHDASQTFTDATLPDTGSFVWQTAVPGSYVINGVTYKYSLSGARPWKLPSLDGSVYVSGPGVKLWVQNSFNFPSDGQIMIPTGNSLSMFVTAPTATIGGNGVINQAGVSSSFQYYGLPANIAFSLSANAVFVGLIYAPEAVFTLGGGGNNTYDFIGASITKSSKMNGHFNFHFDEASNTYLQLFGYSAMSWDEL